MSKTVQKAQKIQAQKTLAEQLEGFRLEVVEKELKTRFWKAEFEYMDYFLKCDEIKDRFSIKYEEHQALRQKMQDEFVANLQKGLADAQAGLPETQDEEIDESADPGVETPTEVPIVEPEALS